MKVLNIIEDGRLAGPQVRVAGVGQRLHSLGVRTVVALPRGDNARFKALLQDRAVELGLASSGSTESEEGEQAHHHDLDHAQDALRFFGPCDDVPSALAAADVYVCSSTHEASPISVWEAMSMARPIVSTDVGDVARFLQDGVCGFVVPPKDPEALAAKVLAMLEDVDGARTMGREARRAALENLSVDAVAGVHKNAYEAVVRRSR